MFLLLFYFTHILPIDLHEMELDLIVLSSLVPALFFSSLSPLFSGIFGVLGIMFGLAAWIGMLLKEFNIRVFGSHVFYCLFDELKFI